MEIDNNYINLSVQERDDLFKKYFQTKDNNIRKILVCANLPLVLSIAKKVKRITHLPINDLFQEGVLGLIKAIDYYDYTKGYAFSTIATTIIYNRLLEKAELNLIHLPCNLRQNIYKLRLLEDEFWASFGREPSYEEMAKELNVSLSSVINRVIWNQNVVSFSEKVSDEEPNYLVDTLPREEKDVLPEYLDKALSLVLDDKELVVVLLYFGFFDKVYSLDNIGKLLGYSSETIRKIKDNALIKLKYYLDKDIVLKRGTFTIRNFIDEVTDDELANIINSLNDYEKSILNKRYNKNLTKIKNNEITLNEIYVIFLGILPKINNIFNVYSINDVLKMAGNNKDIINNVYGFLTVKEKNTGLISKKKKEIIEFYIVNYGKSILEVFPKNYYYEIEAAAETLEKLDIYFLTKRLGTDYLENPISDILEYKDYEKIVNLIKIIESNLDKLNLFMYFPKASHFEVIEALRYINDSERDSLIERFGSDFNTLNDVNTEILKKSLAAIDYVKIILERFKTNKKFQRYKLSDLYPKVSEEFLKESIKKSLTPSELETMYYYFREELDSGINITNPDIKLVLNKINDYINI